MRRNGSHSRVEYFITAGVITVLFLAACAYRHIIPFGNALLVNESDFSSQSVPIYMHLWDALHGRADLFFDWRFGLGSNFAGTLSHYSLISPFSLFFLFVSRESIPYVMTWYVLIKLIAMGLTMCCFLRNDRLLFRNRLSSPLVIAGACGYALSGYAAQYYGFPWIDTAVFVPLLFLCLNGMLGRKERAYGRYEVGYTLFLALIAIINIPQAYAVCLAVMGYACGILMMRTEERAQRQTASLKLICTSLLGIAASMAIFLPAYLNISHSFRMTFGNYGSGLASYIVKMDLQKQETYRKYLILLGSAVPLAGGLLSFGCTEKKQRRFCLYLFFLAAAPIFFESVNGIYHNGPYSCYPMRYGFLTAFLITAAGLSMTEGNRLFHKPAVLSVLIAVWACLCEGIFAVQIEASGPYDYEALRQAVKEDHEDVFARYKQADASMMENYPLYADLPALSNYVPLNSLRQVNFVRRLGYAQNWVALDDAGGTVFTDALLGIKTVLADEAYAETFVNLTEGSGLYGTPEPAGAGRVSFAFLPETGLPFMKNYDPSLAQINEDSDPFEEMNRLSKALYGRTVFECERLALNAETASHTLFVAEKAMLYVWIPDGDHSITVSGKPLAVPVYGNPSNERYPRDTDNGILLIGTFEQEDVRVEIQSAQPGGEAVFGILPVTDFTEAVQISSLHHVTAEVSGAGADMNVSAEEDGYVILPFYADEGWTYRTDGVRTEPKLLYGMFPVMPVHAGENRLTMRFIPEGLAAGAVISAVSLVLLCILALTAGRAKERNALGTGAEWAVKAVWIVYLLYVYIIPILFRAGMSVYKRLF